MLLNRCRFVLNSFNISAIVSMSVGSTVWPALQSLYERLQVAEELGTQVNRDLSSILEQLKNISKAANTTYPTSNTTTTISTGSVSEKHVVGSGVQQALSTYTI